MQQVGLHFLRGVLRRVALYVGIDVSKASLDICVGMMGRMSTLGNDGAGHDALCRMLKPLKVGLVVLEGTGGFGWLRVCVRGCIGVGASSWC